MNHCDKIHYHILTTEKAGFAVMADRLLAQLPEKETLLRLAFFGTPVSNQEYMEHRQILRDKIGSLYKEREPSFSYVSPPPLEAPLILEVHSYTPDPADRITFHRYGQIPYVLLTNHSGRFLFAGGFQGDVLQSGIEQQSGEVFRQIKGLLAENNFPVRSIVRQWNYIERITAFDGPDQHYQSFNNARSDFYRQTGWPEGYPAATGIGANSGGVLVDLDAVCPISPDTRITPVDNRLQIAAHAYSDEVLENARQKKTTPKFERAKKIVWDECELVYISGTAAIRGEESLKGVGLEKQLHVTMENIAELTGKARPVLLRVYLKRPEDYPQARQWMQSYASGIPVSYMWADVCRDELLIEIEGIALMNHEGTKNTEF